MATKSRKKQEMNPGQKIRTKIDKKNNYIT